MPSKGIDCYSYISPLLRSRYEIEFVVPEDGFRNGVDHNFTKKHLEIESSRIPGLANFVGRFQWTVYQDGRDIATGFNNINTLTGNLAAGGTMLATQHFTPIITQEAIITYGFYDSGNGHCGLTNHDQCYVYVTPLSNQHWMGQLAPPGSLESSKPFSAFALVAPHDNGMNTTQSFEAVLAATDEDMVKELKQIMPRLSWFDHIPDSVLVHMLPNIVYGVSVTQKKSITVMLTLGARYFEFRPAKLLPMFQRVSHLENKFYFQHACIPGIAFDDFLTEQVAFLDTHPTEICVIHIRHDNIVKDCELPTWDEITELMNTACAQARNAPLKWGDRACFAQPIQSLRDEGVRMIVVQNAEKYDSWTAQAYATLTADPILARFDSMNTEGQSLPGSGDLTILQCQATSQSIKDVLVYSVVASNAATSCLTSTKGDLDRQTLPWIRMNATQRLQARDKLLVIMNDFIDGATCETGIEVSRERLSW